MSIATTVSVQQAASDIDSYIKKSGVGYRRWYCGIAADARDRLFRDHNVSEKGGRWIYADLSTDSEARTVEQHFLSKGCDGGAGGGDRTTRSVYVYLKTLATNP